MKCFRFFKIQTILCFVLSIAVIFKTFIALSSHLELKNQYDFEIRKTDVVCNGVKPYNFIDCDYKYSRIKSAGGEGEENPNDVSLAPYILTAEICPPTKGSVTSQFGYRIHPIFKTKGFHTGIDIAYAMGTDIMAAFSGKIDKVGTSEAYGNYLIMKHSESLYTFYGHCSSIKAKEGMFMRKGEVIAYMGNTGYSTGPHLHFEIRISGKRVDPLYALKGFDCIAI